MNCVSPRSISLTPIWFASVGTDKRDEGKRICFDPSGDVYLAGMTVRDLQGSSDAFLVKLSPEGKQIWFAQEVEAMKVYGFVPVSDVAGQNVYLAGYMQLPNSLEEIAFLAKYDPTGKRLWRLNYKVLSIFGAQLDCCGNLVVSGFVSGAKIFVKKIDPNGKELWSAEEDAEGCWDVALDGAGNVFISGVHAGDAFVSKYDSTGRRLWHTTWRANFQTSMQEGRLAVDARGNVVACGVIDVQAAQGSFVIRLNANGKVVKSWIFGEPKHRFVGITADDRGQVFISGDADDGGNRRPFVIGTNWNLDNPTLYWLQVTFAFHDMFDARFGPDGGLFLSGTNSKPGRSHEAFVAKYDFAPN